MRFTITPLGSVGGRTVDQVVGDIVRYLNRPRPAVAPGLSGPAAEGPSRYYADGGDEPGRWLGQGAQATGLAGEVDPQHFARVLAGRDPLTGERLITARGSAGRRATLGVGASTRRAEDGEALYDEHDAAAALGVEADVLERLLAAGEQVAAHPSVRRRQPAGSYLLSSVDAGGTRWVTEGELARVEAARAAGPSPEEITAAGGGDDLLPLAEAARLTGLTGRYLRGLARRWEQHRDEIEQARQEGRPVGRAYIVAWRGTKNRWLIKRSDLAEFVAHRKAPAVRVGFDLTLTTEKSLGVLALLGGDDSRAAVLEAIEAGNDLALRWWERHAAARVNGEVVPAEGWTAASFRHLTSRALDPFPHHHNVIANAVTACGERRALDARVLYRHAVGASALATAEMRLRLTTKLGVRWRRSPSGGWEIDGIPREVLREFSRRRNEIEEALAELEEAIGRTSTIEELRNVVAETRPDKQHADPTNLRADWWRRAHAHSFTPGDLKGCVGRTATPEPRSDQLVDLLDRLAAIDGITAQGSIFTRGDVLAALADAPLRDDHGDEQPLLLGAERLEEPTDAFLASHRVIRLEPGEDRPRLRGLGDEPLYTTTLMLRTQQRIIDTFRNGLHARSAVATDDAVETVLAAGQLSDEQAELVRRLCTSGHHLQCAIGRAGTGKTTAMRAAAAAWTAAGYRVVGAAIKGEATRALGTAAGIPTETVAWYLAHTDPYRGPLDSRTVLIVDESSTLGDADLDRLLRTAQAAGATVRLIGDPAQHGAVAAGGMFRVLCEHHPGHTPQLTENRRLQHPGDLAAVEALRDGHIEHALAQLEAAGHLHLAADDVQLYARLLARWWEARQNGAPHPLVERSNHRRRQLNRLARRVLQAHGETGTDEVPASGERAFSVGDEVIARRGNRDLHPDGDPHAYVRNGARGTVTRITHGMTAEDDSITVAFESGTVTVPRWFFDAHPDRRGRLEVGIDHAYAVTSYAVQGATFESSTSRIDERATRAETYVDITRGRQDNHLYATRAEDPLDGEQLPKAPPPPLEATLTIRLRASTGEITAWELDPHALDRAREPMARSLP